MTSDVTDTVELELGWPAGPCPADFEIGNVRAVTPNDVVDDARIVVREGRIAEIGRGPARGRWVLNARGLLVIPGIIDVHSDALEKEQQPRPNAPLPWEFALESLEGRLVGAGITTVFHGAAFQHQTYRGVARSTERATDLCRVVEDTVSYRVDHRILHRLDILSDGGAEVLKTRLEAMEPGSVLPLVSHEDHTPGQGQYVDPSYMVKHMVGADGKTQEEAEAAIERLIREGEEQAHIRRANLDWLGELARAGRIRLEGHDPDGIRAIDELGERGGVIAEFPTTVAAAVRAREHGMWIVAGAPNLLRGGSHAGNVSVGELVAEGLVDGLASDYLPSALLGSVWAAARSGITDLPSAIGLVTAGPARLTGLDDRGRLEPGYRADLALIDDRLGNWPVAVATLRAGLGLDRDRR